ncbi:hypothetical protein [Actinomyces gaoshouyii]|uniref:Uncharacterized protein n=1 Tax=Actinomyces gaoshouyii TaxID=1960083 RepID=A0A8H9H7P4_9ACTO|nr:hypothetical protein GCM10011612_04140 [Actinomyces gaoshouyii]
MTTAGPGAVPGGPASGAPGGPAPRVARSFSPGRGFAVLVVAAMLVVILALAAALASALGARGTSAILGGIALLVVGLGLIAALRVPARSLVVNAPRLRLDRNRAAAARKRATAESARTGGASSHGRLGRPAAPGAELTVIASGGSTAIALPEPSGRRELTALDVVSGPVSTALVSTSLGRAVDERLSGTTMGESLLRLGQILVAAFGFLLISLGLASILGQVI